MRNIYLRPALAATLDAEVQVIDVGGLLRELIVTLVEQGDSDDGAYYDAVVGLALLDANIWLIAACIGFTTFALATLGLLVGKAAGARLGKIVELVGGVALIAPGLKILLEHLGVLAG